MPETPIPKNEWGPGPWQDEPDRLDWRDERTGLPCAILRNMHVTGSLCGYVGVPVGHAFYGWSYSDKIPSRPEDWEGTIDDKGVIPVFAAMFGDDQKNGVIDLGMALNAHGDVTWSGELPRKALAGGWDGYWWFGFDCGHAGDSMPAINALLHRIMPPEHMAWKAEHGYPEVYRTVDYVKQECTRLAFQLRQLETRVIETPMPEALKAKSANGPKDGP